MARADNFAGLPLAIAALRTADAHASAGYFLHGTGSTAKNANGRAIALPQDTWSVAIVPATATKIDESLEVGVDVFILDRGTSIRENAFGLDGDYDGNGTNHFVLRDISYLHPLSDRDFPPFNIFSIGGMASVNRTDLFVPLGDASEAGIDLQQGFIGSKVEVCVAGRHNVSNSGVGLVQGFPVYGIQPCWGSSANPATFFNRRKVWEFGKGVKVGHLSRFRDWVAFTASHWVTRSRS